MESPRGGGIFRPGGRLEPNDRLALTIDDRSAHDGGFVQKAHAFGGEVAQGVAGMDDGALGAGKSNGVTNSPLGRR
jgi:hypothetical protein